MLLKQAALTVYEYGFTLIQYSPSTVLVRSNKLSPNWFARIRQTGFRFIKLIARNRKIRNLFRFGWQIDYALSNNRVMDEVLMVLVVLPVGNVVEICVHCVIHVM